ncbi:hypothetical protein HDR58_01240 [bacterium]|nr:hypothetical protein [bacterium]
MGFNDFWVNNNGKKEQLNNTQHGVRKDQVDKKHYNLFDAYDTNNDGTLEDCELNTLFTGLTKFSGSDKVLDTAENKQVASLFANQAGIQDVDFMGFVKSVSDASEQIISSLTSKGVDGGNVITTTYKNGLVETIYYYPDGEFKLKTQKQDSVTESTTYVYTNDGKEYKQCSQDELDKMIKADYKKYKAANSQNGTRSNDGFSSINIIMGPDVYKSDYMKRHNVNPITNRSEIHIDNTDMSERAQAEAEIKDFVVSHFVQTHKDCQTALDTMGILDDIGAAINAGAGELWNSCKNIYNKYFGDGTESDYQNFYELVKNFEPNYGKALVAEGNLADMRVHSVGYFTGETGKIDAEKGLRFQQITERYQNATILKSRIDILKDAMREISMYENEQNALIYAPAQSEGMNPTSHILKANSLLLQYFDGDKEAVNLLLSGAIGNTQSTINAIKGIADDTQKMFDSVTNGKSFDEIKNDYQTQYKEMYETDFVPDELTEKIMDAKATGGMVKLAAITAISILITKSPVIAEISAAAGGAEVTGAAANMIRTLATKYGATAVQQGIKFAMTSGTLATDVGLTLLNQVTSEHGVNGEELWESTKDSAKYIYFGAYVGAPLAQAVSKQLGKIGATANLFEGGVKSANGAIQTTSISGEKLVQNLMKGGSKVLTTGGAFLTDVAAFSALEVATEGMDPLTAGKEQTEMLGKLKVMNHFIEYMLGGKVHVGMSKAQMDATIERSGIKNWDIKEIKAPNKIVYEVEVGEGLPPMRFEDKNQLATAMLDKIAGTFNDELSMSADSKTDSETEFNNILKDSSNEVNKSLSQGMSEQDNAILRNARKENPAGLVEERVLTEVAKDMNDEGMRLNTAESLDAELDFAMENPDAPVENFEALSLIIDGKLNEHLTQRYDEMGKVFSEIAQKRSADIKELAKANPKNKQVVAEGIVKILAEELGMKGFEPPIKFENTDGGDGYADWPNGKIVINKNITNVEQLTKILSHEFVHMLQYRDVLAQYGKQGLVDLINNDKSIPADKKEECIQNALNNEYNKNLLSSYDFHNAQTGSVEDYIRRIYKEEFTNTIGTDDMVGYTNQVTEREAYHLGSEKLGENTEGLHDVLASPSSHQERLAQLRAKLKTGQDVTNNNEVLKENSTTIENFEIDEFGQFHRKGVPTGFVESANVSELIKTLPKHIQPKANNLLNAIKNNREYRNYSDSSVALSEFETVLERCKIDGEIDENLLSYAQKLCEITGNKIDQYLASGQISDVRFLLYRMQSASPEIRQQMFNAAKELYTMPNCRNSVVEMMVYSCVEQNSGVITFNSKAFNKIKDMIQNKPEHHKYRQDYSYSLRVAEIAKSSVIERCDENGNYVRSFDEVGFELAKIYDASSSLIVHISFNEARMYNDGNFELSNLSKSSQRDIAKILIERIKARTNGKYDSEINDILNSCNDNPAKLFAANYMLENLHLNKFDTYQLLKEFRSTETVVSDLQRLSNNINIVKGLNLYDGTGTNIILTELLKSGLDAKEVLPILKNKEIFKFNFGSLETIFSVVNVSKGKDVPYYSSQPEFLLHQINNRIMPDVNLVKALYESGVDVIKMQTDALYQAEYHLPEIKTPSDKSSFLQNILSTWEASETRLKNSRESENILTYIESGIPEFADLPNKQQTVTLLQNIMNSTEYAKLDNQSKTILKYSVILKDIPPETQKAILKEYNVPDNLCKRIQWISKNYGGFGDYVNAAYLQNGNDFEVYKIFKTEQSKLTSDVSLPDFNAIQANISKARTNNNLLYASQIVNANLIPERTIKIGLQNLTVRVLDFSDPNLSSDLSQYGFEPGTTKENLRLITHMFNTGTGSETRKVISVMNAITNPNSEGITVSATFRPVSENETFGDGLGIVVSSNEVTSVPAALNTGFHSGLHKTDRTYTNWLFSQTSEVNPNIPLYYEENLHAQARTFLKESLLKELKNNGFELNDAEYAQLTKALSNHKYLSNIPTVKIGDKVIPKDVLSQTIRSSQDKLIEGSDGSFNEVLVNNPKIQAIVTNNDIKYLSPSLITYAQKHNLPIIKVN